MFKLSKQTRSTVLLILALGLVPVTIDACGNGGTKAKDNFEVVSLLGLCSALVLMYRRPKSTLESTTA